MYTSVSSRAGAPPTVEEAPAAAASAFGGEGSGLRDSGRGGGSGALRAGRT